MVPVLVLLMGLTQHTAQGSSLLAMVPIGLTGALTHRKLGNVQTSLLPWMIPGTIAGTAASSLLVGLIPQDILRWLFAAVLLWTVARNIAARKST
jgi:uncharacterized membrane protein YfcA